MAGIEQQLAAHAVIGLDTSIFIYHLEAHQDYSPLTKSILSGVESGQWHAITSTITIMELTVRPQRLNQPDVARQYEALLVNFPNLRLIDVDRDVARRAAQLRARYNIRPADALQVGAAINGGATLWVSNDKKLNRLSPVIEVIILDNL